MTRFQHVTNIGEKSTVSILEDNIKDFLDYCFLGIGGFIDAKLPTSGLYGGDFCTLKPGYHPTCPSGTVWEAPRKEWVYETGVSHNDRYPINVSGVYVNNQFLPSPTGNSNISYHINYRDGQVIFNKPLPLLSHVKTSYSYRYIQIYKANHTTWFKELQQYSYDPSRMNKMPGQIIMADHKVQLPCIIIETIPRTFQEPYQLGDTSNIISQDLLLHVYAENPVQRNSIVDILLLQKDRQSFLYDIDKVVQNNANPLKNNGSINPSGLNYDQILSQSVYRKNVYYISLATTSEFSTISSSLYCGIVRWTIKIYP